MTQGYFVRDIEFEPATVDGPFEVAVKTPVVRFTENSPIVPALPLPTKTKFPEVESFSMKEALAPPVTVAEFVFTEGRPVAESSLYSEILLDALLATYKKVPEEWTRTWTGVVPVARVEFGINASAPLVELML